MVVVHESSRNSMITGRSSVHGSVVHETRPLRGFANRTVGRALWCADGTALLHWKHHFRALVLPRNEAAFNGQCLASQRFQRNRHPLVDAIANQVSNDFDDNSDHHSDFNDSAFVIGSTFVNSDDYDGFDNSDFDNGYDSF